MNLTFGKWFHNVKNKSKIVLTFDKIILHTLCIIKLKVKILIDEFVKLKCQFQVPAPAVFKQFLSSAQAIFKSITLILRIMQPKIGFYFVKCAFKELEKG